MWQFIKHNKSIVKNVSFLIILFGFFMPVAASTIISPASGVWANKQPLIINAPEGYDVYYSLSGSDPLESGFAYDGPVLLDVTGEIPLKVVTVSPNGNRTDETIWLSVNEDTKKLSSLLNTLKVKQNSAYTVCSNQTQLSIPQNYKYSLNNSEEPYITGNALSLDPKNSFSRYESLVVSDGTSFFRFMLFIQGNDVMEEPPVPPAPIKCDEWDYVSFTSDFRIQYSLDDGPWIEARKPFYLDRSKSHTISWQYIPDEVIIADTVIPVEPVVIDTSMRGRIRNYILPPGSGVDNSDSSETDDLSLSEELVTGEAEKKPVYYAISSFELPPKPDFMGLPANGITNEKVTLSLNEDGYLLRCLSDGFSHSFSNKITVDCWNGSQLNSDLLFEVYYAGVYQGTLSTNFIIDKKPPRLPEFTSTTTAIYSRSSVLLQVGAEGTVYYSIDKAVQSTTGFTDEMIEKLVGSDINSTNRSYTPLDGRSILLPEKQKTAVLYFVHAFARDEAGNNSEDSGYYVVVDPSNYYIDTSKVSYENATGSPSHPLNSITSVLQSILDTSPFTRLFLSGEFNQDLSLVIKNDCEIIGKNDARIHFSDVAGFSINNATVSISGCLIELNSSSPAKKTTSGPDTLYRKTLITGSGMKLSLDNCEIVVVFPTSGSVFMLDNSELNLRNCGITIKADSYSTIVTSENSSVTLDAVRCSSVGETSLIFSMNDGVINAKNSTCTVTAVLGRIAELSGTKYSFINNRFVSNNLLNSKSALTSDSQLIWTDKESVVIENKGNVYE